MNISFYFKVHQPYRLKRYDIFRIGQDDDYFNEPWNEEFPIWENRLSNRAMIEKTSRKCYRPANQMMLELLKEHPDLKVSYSLSGVYIEQLKKWAPDVLDSFKKLADTGQVEFLGETYYHSLSFLADKEEFEYQVKKQEKVLRDTFGVTPTIFSNTEAAYNNQIGEWAAELGYQGVLTEGADRILEWRSPNFIYHHPQEPALKLLLKNYKLSDDIAFRFHDAEWAGWPLTAEKFAGWMNAHHGQAQSINLAMDYETLGEHQWEESGIFEFFRHLPAELKRHPDTRFAHHAELAQHHKSMEAIDVPDFITWADTERDLSAWQENAMQQTALRKLHRLKNKVMASNSKSLQESWRRLQTSDHFYYMCTKWWNDGDVHKYFSPHGSPYDAFAYFMNALNDLEMRCAQSHDHNFQTSNSNLQTISST